MPRQRQFGQQSSEREDTTLDPITAKLTDLEYRISQLEQVEERLSQLEQAFEEATSVAVPNSPDLSVMSKLTAIENSIKHIEQRLQSDLPQAKATLSKKSSQEEPPKAEKGFWDGFFWGAFKHKQ